MAQLQIWVKSMEKKDIRKQIFARRKQHNEEQRLLKSRLICSAIMKMPAFQEAECVYAYMDSKGEVCMDDILTACWESGKRIAVPKVFGKDLRFFYIEAYDQVEAGYFDIREPLAGLTEAADEKALMIVPGVAFDKDRHRCGYGGGFYDRYLSVHKEHLTISPAFGFQIIPMVPAEEFDVFPQMIVTEQEIIQ